MGIEIIKNDLKKNITGYVQSSKVWEVGTRHRRLVNINDGGVRQTGNLIEVDMSGWTGIPTAADWSNYVRVYSINLATEIQTEIKSQTYDKSFAGGNHDSIAILLTSTTEDSNWMVYFGSVNLGASGYTSDLTVTADAPAAGDYTVQQDDYYKMEIDYSRGGIFNNIYTRVSGGNVDIGNAGNNNHLGKISYNKAGTWYENINELTPTITLVEGATGANAGAVFVAFKITGVLEDGANNPLQDNSAVNVTYEIIYLFCECQLFKVIKRVIFVNDCDNIQKIFIIDEKFLNAYFSHQGYKYSSTHAVEVVQDRDISANYATKKYLCYFDITSNDGIIIHFIDETIQNYENVVLKIDESVGYELFSYKSDDSGTNTTYTAGTEELIIICQIDDFTEADGNNDDDGDQPAHRKSNELQSTITETEIVSLAF